MKTIMYSIGLLVLMCSCSEQKELALVEKVDGFKVSECRDNCSIDSVGIRRNEVKDGDLYIKFGYFLNCAWEDAFIKEVEERNDTMIIHMDRPHDVDTTLVNKSVDSDFDGIEDVEIVAVYPIYDCDCFFFFNMIIEDVVQAPKVIRIAPEVDRDKFWDQSKKNAPRIKSVKGVYDLNESPVKIKNLVLNTQLFDVTSGVTDAQYLDDFCNYKDYHLQRTYNLISKIDSETFSYLKVYVNDDRFKMSRRHAREIFQSIDVNYKYIKLWNTFRVGMSLDELMTYISSEEYHNDTRKVTMYTSQFTSEFFHDDKIVTRIKVQRRCDS
ncbi:hypothetical protein [uncultured Psychroserpens sp.]|uniref:hypothetical protein n=1 Tax=uncultured Psychroserpens sp. TaxID=255436 RepID=UPI002603C8A0|nr:hypothetical protein [uncultured Psychroserpens sp.]